MLHPSNPESMSSKELVKELVSDAQLLIKRQKELLSVAKIVGGVEEVRYQGGRGTAPFKPVPAAAKLRMAV